MPFYEYQCQACGAQVEVLQKISDAPLRKCPECGKAKLVKLVSAPVFRLKGGGWYETDFKSDGEKKRNLVESEKSEPKSEGAAEAKPAGETKAEPKAEAKSEPKSEPKAKPGPKPKRRPAARSRTARKARR